MSWAAVAAGLAPALGAGVGNQMSARQQNRSQDYMTEMSNTAHQREVADLRRAGLNPILSAHSGASTPSVGSAPMSDPISGGVSSAIDAVRTHKEIEAMKSQKTLNLATGEAQKAAALRDGASAKQVKAQTRILDAQYPAEKIKAEVQGKVSNMVNKAMGNVNSAVKMLQPKNNQPGLGLSKP